MKDQLNILVDAVQTLLEQAGISFKDDPDFKGKPAEEFQKILVDLKLWQTRFNQKEAFLSPFPLPSVGAPEWYIGDRVKHIDCQNPESWFVVEISSLGLYQGFFGGKVVQVSSSHPTYYVGYCMQEWQPKNFELVRD